MSIGFERFAPLPQLQGYVESIWAFESSGPLPDETRWIVPNGRLLLLVPYRNGLVGTMDGRRHVAPQHAMALVGISDCPSRVDTRWGGPSGSIGVDISPLGAYRFFHLRLKDVRNGLHHVTDLAGATARAAERKIAGLETNRDRVRALQRFLLGLFSEQEEDPLFEYCVHRIEATQGLISVRELERTTGYSSRWLNRRFEEKLGISPKNLGSIVRFHASYRALLSDPAEFFRRKELYRRYYDQSHFIREFKRYTGMTPSVWARSSNEFAGLFVQESTTSDPYNTELSGAGMPST